MRTAPAPIEHYENFPVASWLCPRALRPPVAAIYHFARVADDLADEGQASAAERLAGLAAYRRELHACATGTLGVDGPWPHVFQPLAVQMQAWGLPLGPFEDLLSAFEQDVRQSAAAATHDDLEALLDYCRRSANPIGRLLLHLHGVASPWALAESDAICSALQLTNFWQDLAVDIPRGRYYLPLAECARHGIPITNPREQFPSLGSQAAAGPLIAALVNQARALMRQGQPLVHRLPGRAGWELRAVVQGGLRVLDKVEALGPRVLRTRPVLTRGDVPLVLWRMLRMPARRMGESGA